jgi:hypothetical protein
LKVFQIFILKYFEREISVFGIIDYVLLNISIEQETCVQKQCEKLFLKKLMFEILEKKYGRKIFLLMILIINIKQILKNQKNYYHPLMMLKKILSKNGC